MAAGPGRSLPVWLAAPDWHTGVVLRRADIPEGLVPESSDFPKANYLEFGWGDRDYYPAPEPGPWLALRAALVPGPAVLHVAGFHSAPPEFFGTDHVLRIDLPPADYRRLAAFVHESFARDGTKAAALGPGLYGDSRFYPARGGFHLFENCNVWTARALQAGGLAVNPGTALTPAALRRQLPAGPAVLPPGEAAPARSRAETPASG
jgi:uncharacterized protein (TIGR02117 family)